MLYGGHRKETMNGSQPVIRAGTLAKEKRTRLDDVV